MIGQIQKQRQVYQYVLILDIMIVSELEVLMEELVFIKLRVRLFDFISTFLWMCLMDYVWGMERLLILVYLYNFEMVLGVGLVSSIIVYKSRSSYKTRLQKLQ